MQSLGCLFELLQDPKCFKTVCPKENEKKVIYFVFILYFVAHILLQLEESKTAMTSNYVG